MECETTRSQVREWLEAYLHITYPAERFYVGETSFRGNHYLDYVFSGGQVFVTLKPVTIDLLDVTVNTRCYVDGPTIRDPLEEHAQALQKAIRERFHPLPDKPKPGASAEIWVAYYLERKELDRSYTYNQLSKDSGYDANYLRQVKSIQFPDT